MTQEGSYYYVPSPSYWPLVGALALLLLATGAVLWVNHYGSGPLVVAAGGAVLGFKMGGGGRQGMREYAGGMYNKRVDVSFRWAMSWFIFSEVMFFAAFFGALFYARVVSVPDLASVDSQLLWPSFSAIWPNAGPGFKGSFSPMEAMGIPAINTLLLLTSGATLTWAHWGLMKNQRTQLTLGLIMTIALGVLFLTLQVHEYSHAYAEMNLKLTTGIYGTTFFMLTGFHGLHVTIGVTMLTVMLFRVLAGHFKPDHHFAFEAVAWYWHFVDVVWLLLFVVVYWL